MSADIIDTFARIAHEFTSLNLEVPESVILKDHDQGMRVLHQIHQRLQITIHMGPDRGGKVIEHPNGLAWMEAEIYGIKVRWPAKKLAMEGGGYVWI